MKPTLFIGGSNDGVWANVPEDAPYWKLRDWERPPVSVTKILYGDDPEPYYSELYRREVIHFGPDRDDAISIFVHDSMTMRDAFFLLLREYA